MARRAQARDLASYPDIHHSGGNDGSDVLTITLGSAFDLASLTICNRGEAQRTRRLQRGDPDAPPGGSPRPFTKP